MAVSSHVCSSDCWWTSWSSTSSYSVGRELLFDLIADRHAATRPSGRISRSPNR